MADRISVRFDTSDAVRGLSKLKASGPPAVARALNRAITTTRVFMVREVRNDLGLKASTVQQQFKLRRATAADPRATLSVSGARIPLIEFSPVRGPEPSRGRGRGVSARLKGGRGRYPHAFIATMRSGHRGVFQRKPGSGRSPIYELKGPSLPHVFAKYVPAGLAVANTALVKNLEHELSFALSKVS